MPELKCPPLPSGSVDFNAFHEALPKARNQADVDKALTDAASSTATAPASGVASKEPAAKQPAAPKAAAPKPDAEPAAPTGSESA